MLTDFPMDLITGNEKIDLQHMELVARIKMLHESYLSETNTEKLIETFNYIKSYINEHFATEENYMIKHNYPHYERHLNLEKLFKKDGLSSDFSLDFNVRIIEWLRDHVRKEDVILANFIREKEANSKEKKI